MTGDLLREFASYPGLLWKAARARPAILPKKVAFGPEKDQYFLHFAPRERKFGGVVFYLHGGGWNSGSPTRFSIIGDRLAREGYHCVLLGYRKAPWHRWPCQMEDICAGFRRALQYLAASNISFTGALVVGYGGGDAFYRKAKALGIPASLCLVSPERDSHSVYTAGCFLEEDQTLKALLDWMAVRGGAL